jgi:catecholate siderophore receptor
VPLLLALLVSSLVTTPVTAAAPIPALDVRGRVVDASGAVVAGAAVTLRDTRTHAERHAVTDAGGNFLFPAVGDGRYLVVAIADGFTPAVADVDTGAPPVTLRLEPAPVSEQITVSSQLPEVGAVSTGLKIAASPMDIPQTIEAVPQTLLHAQAARSMTDALRNVTGVTPNLGEGRRDQFLIRGFSAASDTLVDGVRDDAQYYRDLATVERVEVLKGPASALFGRGSSGGIINRVIKRPRFDDTVADVALMAGGFGTRRLSFDANRPLATRRVAFRFVGAVEDSDSFRDFAQLSRLTLAPSFSAFLSPSTTLTTQLEYLHDRRLPDRGIPSVDGLPADVRSSQYYGYPADDFIRTDVFGATVTAEHHFANGWIARNTTRAARYGTAFSNTQPTGVRTNAAAVMVQRSQYNAEQNQQNLFSQSEAVGIVRFARVTHTILAGVEAGRQQRQVARFNGTAPDVALIDPVLTAPSYVAVPSSDTAFTGNVLGVYLQDLVAIGAHWKALAGLRGDRFDQGLDDRSPKNVDLARVDRTWSPRVGVVYQPAHGVSIYSSVSHSFQPSGEGLSLAQNAAELGPESTRNLEGGVKLALAGGRATATASVFRLDRTNIKTTDPLDPTRLVLVGRQRTDGVEVAFDGAVTARWTLRAGYAGLAAAILKSNSVLSGVPIEGNRAGLVPRHSGNLWSMVDVTPRLTLGAGMTAAGDRFTSNDDLVRLPGYLRVDAVASYRIGSYELALNLQNLLNERYPESAGSNFNIYPGAPRHALVTARYTFR